MARARSKRAKGANKDKRTLRSAVAFAKREAVEQVLAQADGSVAEAAAELGILRTSLYRIMKRYGIAAPTRNKTQD